MSHEALLGWFDAAKRDLPWRRTFDPYAIWVSEIMLQQTQVSTVIPYWLRWMERFPTVETLAVADEQDVLSLWQGLGYYRRCKLLLAGARHVAENGMPTKADAWLQVPGVGRYTAGAIASIGFGEPAALVDGNVERVFARLSGCRQAGAELNRAAWKWASQNVPRVRPGDWNQALMELGATTCMPREPRCGLCPLREECIAFAKDLTKELPVAETKRKPVALTHTVWIPVHDGQLGLRQIQAGAWWAGMWEFPRAESEDGELRDLVGEGWLQALGVVRHTVTHHRITLQVSLVRCEERRPSLMWFDLSSLGKLALPSPQRKALKMALHHIAG